MNLHEFLISKGWKRSYKDFKDVKIASSESMHLSSYGPLFYSYKHHNYPEIEFIWGLHVANRPPIFHLSRINYCILTKSDKYLIDHDLWFNTLKTFEPDVVYDAFINEKTIFVKEGVLSLSE